MSDFDLLFSSQGSHHDQEQVAPLDMMPSSPLGPASRMANLKPRKPPSITPKRFTKFFTPHSSLSAKSRSGKSGRQLRDITKNAVNRKASVSAIVAGFDDIHPETPHKRRKLLPCPDSSPIQSSPLRPSSHGPLPQIQFEGVDDSYWTDDDDHIPKNPPAKAFPLPIRRLGKSNSSTRILQRSFGGHGAIARGRVLDHCALWQAQTANFYTHPGDCHSFRGSALPFCATPCHSNSLVAIGDEDGGIRLVDSAHADGVTLTKQHVSFKPHSNAVMDIAFSSDDYLFATASGDQTARIIDMRTQQTRYIMTGHMSSVKQVRFQPGNDSIVATSSRDGSVLLWDLRCRGSDAPVSDFRVSFEPGNDMLASRHKQVIYASTCMSIRDAHAGKLPPTLPTTASTTTSLFAKSDSSKRLDVSITALSFLPSTHSHLLLTASEANASVKLWDIRHRGPRNGPAIPVSSTPEPESHTRHRHFGINSLALSGDGSRFYALCRDSTVYAYSTNHLILGDAPELSNPSSKWRRSPENQTGLGPLYGFRHPQFHATSFYVKAAIRPAKGDKPEMLAVGSRDACAVLFPTDETLLNKPTPNTNDADEEDEEEDEEYDLPTLPSRRPQLPRKASATSMPHSRGAHDTIPIYEQGTALIRGHSSEVTSLTWTADGDLVTLGDDYRARCWREGPKARELRTNGEGEGQRWGCGWADVGESYDEEE